MTLVEVLAAYTHDLWARYMRDFLRECTLVEDGMYLIPSSYAESIKKIMPLAYRDLPREIQALDRKEAHRILDVICAYPYPYDVSEQKENKMNDTQLTPKEIQEALLAIRDQMEGQKTASPVVDGRMVAIACTDMDKLLAFWGQYIAQV